MKKIADDKCKMKKYRKGLQVKTLSMCAIVVAVHLELLSSMYSEN